MAVALGATGIAANIWPRCLAGMAGSCTRLVPDLSPAERDRVNRVVATREDAEGISSAYGRYLGAAALVLAGLELVRAIPFILPYALFCLASAGVALLAYLQFHRATRQRVAPLVRRSPFTALPPFIIAAMVSCFAVSLAFVAYTPERLSALVVALSTLVLGVIAWRIAVAPALLVGVDPQWEYAIDERVRIFRARTVANLACAPTFVFVALVEPTLPQQYASLGQLAFWITAAAFAVSFVASLLPLRGRLRVA